MINAGYVVDLNTQQVADSLSRLLADPELRQQCGERGRKLVTTEFTWPAFAEKIVRYYREHIPAR